MKTIDTTAAGAAQAAAQRQRLAYKNGQTARRAGRPLADSNPYPRGRQSYFDFDAGWRNP